MEVSGDRRRFPRFAPANGAYVAMPLSGQMGPIKDISLSGLGCTLYAELGERQAISSEMRTPFPVDIFVSGDKFLLRNISCRAAYDVIAPEDRLPYSASVAKRRCGLKFHDLSGEQKQQITHFLANHAVH